MAGKVKLIGIAGVAVVGLGFGAKTMLGGHAAAADPNAPATTTTTAPGPIESLDSVTLNVADGHYLKVGLALQLSAEAEAGGGGHEGAAPDLTTKWAKGLDLAIEVLGRKTYGELVSPDGRAKAKAELEGKLRAVYPHVVEGLYFTEFVLQ